MNRRIIEEWNKIYEKFPEYVGMSEVIPIELENNSKQIEENLKTILTLEYMGIHIEDTKEQDFKQLYYFSVPEKSTIETNDFLNDQIKTSDGLIQVAKDFLAVMIISSCKSEFDDREEFIPKSVVIQIIDEIESDINDINHKLEHINGLTEVDEIKKQVSELSTKLY